MIGVFDPKPNQAENGSKMKSIVSIGALLVVIAGIGGVAASRFTTTTPETETTDMANLTSLSAERIPNDLTSTQLPVQLTSFQDLEPIAQTEVRSETLRSGDTLTDLMDRLGVSRAEANKALYSLYDNELIDPRKVHPGLEVAAYVEETPSLEDPDAVRLVGMTVKAEREASLVVSRNADEAFSARKLHTRLLPTTRRVTGTVETSLYEAALQAGARDPQVYDFAQIYAYDVDFQREMRSGDQFEILFEEYVDERGRYIRSGDIVFAKLNGHATEKGYYRFTTSDDGVTDYYDESGQSARKFLMKTPINGARLSSNFGYRKHPVLGYNKLHKGTDFAARSGTPIMAAGNGVIERSSWYGSFGNYVRIRHANGYHTAYAHMKGFGPGIKSGRRVKQGDIIGYVGTTGRSTGPHLHYEVHHNGQAVNAMTLNLPTGRKLEGDMMDEFMKVRAEIDKMRGVGETEVLYAASITEANDETSVE